jgi:hypothetical protein
VRGGARGADASPDFFVEEQRVYFTPPNIDTNIVDTSCGTAWRRI